ncbi:plasmid replication protein RepC [Pseudovibrio sp. Alg231-02]|uniref:plasmid replication protein RepC n=1 Tax=Pseudovibrio sp. Alg231-02 TaxID=1922223 RepID=UPI000D55D0F2|nr:plasmid replication protein RepC [Pseudovibrio sp. Alg231-02]
MFIDAYMPDEAAAVFGIGNTSRQQNEKAEVAARSFAGLPVGVSRWDVLSLVKRLQRDLGLTATQVAHLEFLVGYTRDQDWQSGSNPIVYLTVSATANKRVICERQVLNIERALNRAGLVCWHDSGNLRRFGHRSAGGELLQAFGVNLAPLAASYKRLYCMAQELEQRALVWKQQKTTLLLHKKVLREQLTLHPDHPAAGDAQKLLLSLPRRIEARLTITQLLQWSKHLLQLIAVFHEAREPSSTDQIKEDPVAESGPQDRSCRKKTSDRSEIQFRHINTNNTKQTLSNERSSERTLPDGNDLKIALTANAERALEKIEHESAAPARQHLAADEDRSNSPPLPGLEPPSAQAVLLSSGIEHITLKQVLACASPMLRDMIRNASKSGGADWDSVIQAATLAAGYLGISKSAWQEVCSKLGSSAAATLIVIAERRSTDPATTINSYGGFVRGCLAKAKAGDLHLQKSVFGLLSKANLDE